MLVKVAIVVVVGDTDGGGGKGAQSYVLPAIPPPSSLKAQSTCPSNFAQRLFKWNSLSLSSERVAVFDASGSV